MSSEPILSVLMPTLTSRDYIPLLRQLQRQALLACGKVEVLTELDDGRLASGVKRQRLIDRSRGAYVAFVDDDDTVSDDYITSLLAGCEAKVDVVTFCLQLVWPGNVFVERWHYGLHGCNGDNRKQGKMTANHLCAWKRSLATLVGWCPYLGYGDDQLWYKPLVASGYVRTEYHVNRILYQYNYNPAVTANQTAPKMRIGRSYANRNNGLRCFRRGDARELLIESGRIQSTENRAVDRVAVINTAGVETSYPLSELQEYARVRIQ